MFMGLRRERCLFELLDYEVGFVVVMSYKADHNLNSYFAAWAAVNLTWVAKLVRQTRQLPNQYFF